MLDMDPIELYGIAKKAWRGGCSPLDRECDKYYVILHILFKQMLNKVKAGNISEFSRQFYEVADYYMGYGRSYLEFEEEINIIKTQINNAKKVFHVAFPIVYVPEVQQTSSGKFIVGGTKLVPIRDIDFETWYLDDDTERLFSDKCRKDYFVYNAYDSTKRGWHYVEATVRAMNSSHAIEKVRDGMLYAICCVNMQNALNKNFSDILEKKYRLDAVQLIDTYVVRRDDREKSDHPYARNITMFIPKTGTLLHALTDQDLISIKKHIEAYDCNTELKRREKSLILSFNDALIANDINSRQLSFWRCVEIATAKEKNDNRTMEESRDILLNFLNSTDNIQRMKLELVSNIRNKFVHANEVIPIGDFGMRFQPILWSLEVAKSSLDLINYMKMNNCVTKTSINNLLDELASTKLCSA